MRLAAAPLAILMLGAFFVAVHPYWYADGIWYALDLKSPKRLPIDAGHLSWRPLGYALWSAMQLFSPGVGPLVAFQTLAVAGAVCLCFVTAALARRFGFTKQECGLISLFVAVSNFCICYGASGSPYTAASAMAMLAICALIPAEGGSWTYKNAFLAIAAYVIGWSFWAIEVLILPAIFATAYIYASGRKRQRLAKAITLCFIMGLSTVIVATAVYAFLVPAKSSMTFMGWLGESKHGLSVKTSLLDVARAFLGMLSSFTAVGDLGAAIKGLLLGTGGSDWAGRAVPLTALAISSIMLFLGGLGMAAAVRQNEPQARKLALLTAWTVVPVFSFAVIWHGSDVERYALALPVLSLAIVRGLGRFAEREIVPLHPAAWFCLSMFLANLTILILPAYRTSGGIVMSLGKQAGANMPPRSVVIVTGQAMGATPGGPALYYSDIEVHSVYYNLQTAGPDKWRANLDKSIEKAAREGGQVAVLADILGERSPADIGLSPAEYPVPSPEDLRSYFKGWQVEKEWEASGYRFKVMKPPAPAEMPEQPIAMMPGNQASWFPIPILN